MKRTLLDLTQNILSAMNSDEVNSIGDTPESTQVAELIRTVYYNILGRAELPEHDKLFQLASSTNPATPVTMYRPNEGVVKINWIKYFDSNPLDGASFQNTQFGAFSHGLNLDLVQPVSFNTTSTTTQTIGVGTLTFTVASNTLPIVINEQVAIVNGFNVMFGTVLNYTGFTLVVNVQQFSGSGTFSSWQINNTVTGVGPGWRDVQLIGYSDFLHHINHFDPLDPNTQFYNFTDFLNTQTELPDSFQLRCQNNRQPKYCCNIQNYYFLFDAFDNTQDNGLQTSKTMVSGFITPSFIMQDSFIPDLDDWAFPLLLNEAKALAFFELKQSTHPHAEQEITRQWSALQKTKAIVNKPSWFDQLPNFGRRIGTGGYSGRGPIYKHTGGSGWYN